MNISFIDAPQVEINYGCLYSYEPQAIKHVEKLMEVL